MAGKGSAPGERRGGRAKGVPNNVTREIRDELARLFTPEYFKALPVRLAEGKLAPQLESKLLAYRFGEPAQTLALMGADGGPIQVQFVDVQP
jgi:hypothetical protein